MCNQSQVKRDYSDLEKRNVGEAVLTSKYKLAEVDKSNTVVKLFEVTEAYSNLIEKPEPDLIYLTDLTPLRDLFCIELQISVYELVESTQLRKKFMAVATKLFQPSYITGYKKDLMDNLPHELSNVLGGVNRTWLSHPDQTGYVKSVLNPSKSVLGNTYQADKEEIERLSKILLEKVLSTKIKLKASQAEAVPMFKQQAG